MNNHDKPQRPDEIYVGSLIRETLSQRTAIIVLGICFIGMIGLFLMYINKPVPVIVVNDESGLTTASTTQKISYDVIEKQLLYYTRQFCEDYFGRNHVTIREKQKRALEIMHPGMKSKAETDLKERNEIPVVSKENWTDNFNWKLTYITEKNDPRYSTFAQFDIVIYRPGYEPVTQTKNIRLDWGRLVKVADPYERPHSLVLLKVSEIASGSEELKKLLNLSY